MRASAPLAVRMPRATTLRADGWRVRRKYQEKPKLPFVPGGEVSGTIAAVVSAPVAGQLQPIPLAAGDTGVRQPTSVVTNATWTSGSFGLTLTKRICSIPIKAVSDGAIYDWAAILQKIPADACLMVAFMAQNTTAPVILGELSLIDK